MIDDKVVEEIKKRLPYKPDSPGLTSTIEDVLTAYREHQEREGFVEVRREDAKFVYSQALRACVKLGGCKHSDESGGCGGEDVDCDYMKAMLQAGGEDNGSS